MPPVNLMIVLALAAVGVALIIARYRSERRLRKSMQNWQRSHEQLQHSQERRQLAQDRLDRSLDALGEFIKAAKDDLVKQDAANPPAVGDNGIIRQGARFCPHCNDGQIRPSGADLRRTVTMDAGSVRVRSGKIRYYARRGRRLRSASIRAQAIRRLV